MPEVTSVKDEARLQLVAMWFYVLAVIQGLYAIGFFILAGSGFLLSLGWIQEQAWLPPSSSAGEYTAPMLAYGAFGAIMSTISVLAARRVSARRSRSFCLYASMANLLFLPWGTLIGLYSIVVLTRPRIRAKFDSGPGLQTDTPAPNVD